MKHETAKLSGAMLDLLVAMIYRMPHNHITDVTGLGHSESGCCYAAQPVGDGRRFEILPFRPSALWADGGPIIEREGIATEPNDDFCDVGRSDKSGLGTAWSAVFAHDARADGCQRSFATGPTPLIAAMRVFVIGKIGDTVEL